VLTKHLAEHGYSDISSNFRLDEYDTEDDDMDEAKDDGEDEKDDDDDHGGDDFAIDIDGYDDDEDEATENDDSENEEDNLMTVIDEIFNGIAYKGDDEVSMEAKDSVTTVLYLVELHGKLLMVRMKLQCPLYNSSYTHTVEVFEADMSSCVWVPVTNGLGGHTIFMSKLFSKSVPAMIECKKDAIHFIDTRDTFNVTSKITGASEYDLNYNRLASCFPEEQLTWIFPP
jgi:hypothetical protein